MDESHFSEREFPYAWEHKANFPNQKLANRGRAHESGFFVQELDHYFSKPGHDPGLLFRGPCSHRPAHNPFGDSSQSSHGLGSGLFGFQPGHNSRNLWELFGRTHPESSQGFKDIFGQTHPKSSQGFKDIFAQLSHDELEPGFDLGADLGPRTPLPPAFTEIKLLRDIWIKTWDDHIASRPFKQFQTQIEDETKRLGDIRGDQKQIEPTGEVYSKLAYENVKNRWVEQGIWRKRWKGYWLEGPWHHEEFMDSETESEQESAGKRQAYDVHWYREEERLGIRALKQELSRPFHQFIFQVLAERLRTGEQWDKGEVKECDKKEPEFPYLSTVAYQNVKKTWVKRGLWSKSWGILPGRFWKHERPFIETTDPKLWEGLETISFPTRLYFPFALQDIPLAPNAKIIGDKILYWRKGTD